MRIQGFKSSGWLLLLTTIFTTGCHDLGYLWQAGKGQMQLRFSGQSLEQATRDPEIAGWKRSMLKEIPRIKNFGEQFGLNPTRNYERYVELERPAVVWVLTACRPLKFEAKRWQFPIVGSFNYLGWFDTSDVQEYARKLQTEGWETWIRGASAYSTLGWFNDPVLSTMLREDDAGFGDLVNTILHESVHATVFRKDDPEFNESLAAFAADSLTHVFLERDSSTNTQPWLNAERQRSHRQIALQGLLDSLKTLYQSPRSDSMKTQQKADFLQRFQQKWKGRLLNNAAIVGFKTYNSGMERFRSILENCSGDWPSFFAVVKDSVKPSNSQ